MITPPSPAEVHKLRARYMNFLIVQGVLGLGAVLFAVAYFAFHKVWGLPAFAIVLAVAGGVQIRFIWMFRKGPG